VFLGSIKDDLFLRPDLPPSRHRVQGR
jgi:hypothetical protein